MRRCTGPVSCLPFEVVEKPNGLEEGVRLTLSNAPSHPAGNASFIRSFTADEFTAEVEFYRRSLGMFV